MEYTKERFDKEDAAYEAIYKGAFDAAYSAIHKHEGVWPLEAAHAVASAAYLANPRLISWDVARKKATKAYRDAQAKWESERPTYHIREDVYSDGKVIRTEWVTPPRRKKHETA